MPVSGNEDKMGVITRQCSNSSSGVPIKKRRFPLVRSTSSALQEPSRQHVENDISLKEQSKPTQDSFPSDVIIGTNPLKMISDPSKSSVEELKEAPTDTNFNRVQNNVSFSRLTHDSSPSDARIGTNSPGIFGASNSFSKEIKEGFADKKFNLIQNNVSFSRVKHEVPCLPIFSGSMDNMDGKKELISEDTKLQLGSNEGLATNDGKGIAIKHKVESACELELSTVGNDELSLVLKEPLIPSLVVQNSEQTFQIPHEVNHPSVFLSLGKGEPIIGITVDDDGVSLPANRSNWDLNTTMDAWEGSIADATTAAYQEVLGFGGSNGITGLHDAQPSAISSAGIFGASSVSRHSTVGVGDQRSSLPLSLSCASKHYKPDDSFHLRPSSFFLPTNCSGETSGSVAKVASSIIEPCLNFLGVLSPTGSPSSVGCRTVKLELHDENARHNLAEASGNPTGALDLRKLKCGVGEKYGLEALKMSLTSSPKLVEQMPVKSEPAQDNQETQRKSKWTSDLYQPGGRRIARGDDNSPSKIVMATCSTELSMSGDKSNLPEYSDHTTKDVKIYSATPHERCSTFDHVASKTVTRLDNQSRGSNVSDGMTETLGAKDLILEDSGGSGQNKVRELKTTNDHPPDSHGNVEGSVSDQEKFNISTDMLDEDSYSSDFESDGNHAEVTLGDGRYRQFRHDDEEYEDGEFRELSHTSAEGPIVEKRETRNDNLGDSDMDLGSPCDGIITESGVNEEGTKLEDRWERSDEHIKECVGPVINERTNKGGEKDDSLKTVHIEEYDGSLTVQVAGTGSDEKNCIYKTRKVLDHVGGTNVQKSNEMELPSPGATTTGSHVSVTAGGQAAGNNFNETETREQADSTLPKMDPSLNVDAASKDGNTGGNRSRIITLSRATNFSPCGAGPIQGRSFPSRSGRERFFDFDRENLRGNRDQRYNDGLRKYKREKFQDQSFRNSRPNFMCGRGRVSGRLDSQCGNWDSNRDFPLEDYHDPSDYRFSRHKRVPPDGELDGRGFIAATPNGAFIGSGEGGRKPLNDKLPSFRLPFSRRYSPGGREGPATHGNQMIRRIPRNISPSRRMCEDRSDIVGLKHDDKFLRGFPDDDNMDNSVFTRPQNSYDEVGSQFVRGNRSFSSVQRRGGLSRNRSKSPIRSRTRSPGPWASPRRSPDEFSGLPELIHRRSPASNYRTERMRSYISRPSNDLRNMQSGRDHALLRSAMSNRRSPPDQLLHRCTRRFDNIGPRERTDAEYFGRFHELDGDGNGDDRRKSGAGRGPVHNFRPPYNNGADADNFRFHVEDARPRPFRFCSEHDPDFLERSDLRESEFDGRLKGRSLNASRRSKTMEEQEGNYRHGKQEWHDDVFDDVSRGKKRRF